MADGNGSKGQELSIEVSRHSFGLYESKLFSVNEGMSLWEVLERASCVVGTLKGLAIEEVGEASGAKIESIMYLSEILEGLVDAAYEATYEVSEVQA